MGSLPIHCAFRILILILIFLRILLCAENSLVLSIGYGFMVKRNQDQGLSALVRSTLLSDIERDDFLTLDFLIFSTIGLLVNGVGQLIIFCWRLSHYQQATRCGKCAEKL